MNEQEATHCQYSADGRGCPEPRFARLDFESRTGFRWTEGVCQGHQQACVDQVTREGGACLGAHVLRPSEVAS